MRPIPRQAALAPLLLPAVFMLVFLRFSPHAAHVWPAATPPSWLSIALGGFTLYGVIVLFVLEHQVLRGRAGEKLRAQGEDPEAFMALLGGVVLFSPVSMAMMASWFGLPLLHFGIYAAGSAVGIAFWNWRYRKAIQRALSSSSSS